MPQWIWSCTEQNGWALSLCTFSFAHELEYTLLTLLQRATEPL
jgi:hypothetical protein